MLWLALLVTASVACTTDTACSLNGVCTAGRCACDAPWSGSACERLNRGATKVTGGGIYGYSPNVTSWGGNAIQDPSTGTWHLYVAEMAGKRCGLHVWESQSTVAHATASTVEGPYQKQGTVIGVDAHNPQAIVVNGSWYIFHIGSGASTRAPQDCNETANALWSPSEPSAAEGSTLHRSVAGPEGPFTPVASRGVPALCNNPSPVLHPNGTLFLFCTWSIRASLSGSPEGPWTAPRSVRPPGAKDRNWEDPFLFFDQRGNFHVLCHTWSALPYPSNNVSGHGFSTDGVQWTFSQQEPYDNAVTHADGTVQRFATLERPKLLFTDPTKPYTPTHLINGASAVWLDGSDPCAVCGGHCSHCKQELGIDWTYTLMTPLE
jgi:hypothetical protein